MIENWNQLRELALSLALPHVEDAVSWGRPNLKAHGKMWTWWSPMIDAAVFKGSIDEREMLMSVDPEMFVMHDHYRASHVILVAKGRVDPDWARQRLIDSWRNMAPKKVLKEYDATQSDSQR